MGMTYAGWSGPKPAKPAQAAPRTPEQIRTFNEGQDQKTAAHNAQAMKQPGYFPSVKRPGGGGALSYQTGFNANDQAVNEGNILGRLKAEGGGKASQFSGVNDLRSAQQSNDAAQLRRGVQQQNAQQHMDDQAARSELVQTATSNMAKMYGDMAQRSVDQMGLATQLQEAMIRNRGALFDALTQR